jgi:ATP-dependent Clp protease ATP-binding subunit ClpC
MDIFKKFSPNLKKALVEAEKLANLEKVEMDTDHILISLATNKDTLAFEILSSFELSGDRIKLISALLTKKSAAGTGITADTKKCLQLALQSALKYNHTTVGSEHLLLALVSNKTFSSYLTIERVGVDPKKIKKQIEAIFKGINNSFANKEESASPIQFPQAMMSEEGFEDPNFIGGGPMPFAPAPAKKDSALDQYSSNLTRLASDGKLDPVIGREKEISRLIQTLSRRTKNNPILVGEPGVGKTAIVEGLAQRIVNGRVPHKLQATEILSIDLGSILAGTMYRGQFESRIKKILAEIEKRGNIILFVDEIHMMVGAGSTEGSIDAANLLKPMLAKGQLRLIGSTTFDEYKKYIEKDAAFERRFQPITVAEPTVAETIKILNGIRSRYESFHNVLYAPEALHAAADFSSRYIHDRHLPDKAIDLIDEAGAAVNNFIPVGDNATELKNELKKILRKKEDLIMSEKYEEATMLREKEIKLETKIRELQAKRPEKNRVVISEHEIARLVSEWTGVPVATMTIKEKRNYLNLEKQLKKFIIGQDGAITELAAALKRSRVGIGNPRRPIGSFMFLGPTGVGKTELAKVLSREIFGSEDALIKIDMSEFMEKHNVARLIGAPAGYVGYEEGGKLTEAIRKNPYSVILFDEIEKAHPEVFNILLQLMEDGELTDAKGRKVNFKNTIIIMTSNLGTDVLRRQTSIGFNNAKSSEERYQLLKEHVEEAVEKSFRPEFINRLDKVIVFYPLDQASIRKIVDLQVAELEKRLVHQKLLLKADNKVRDFIAKKSYSAEFGARPIRKYIAEHIENLISDAILAEKYADGDTIDLALTADKISLS